MESRMKKQRKCILTAKANTDLNKANEYIAKYSKPEVYNKPYDCLWCHALVIEEMEINNLSLDENPFDNDSYFNQQIEEIKTNVVDLTPSEIRCQDCAYYVAKCNGEWICDKFDKPLNEIDYCLELDY